MAEDRKRKVYDSLLAKGYSDLGSYDEFSNLMAKSTDNRYIVERALKDEGLWDFKDYDDYWQTIDKTSFDKKRAEQDAERRAKAKARAPKPVQQPETNQSGGGFFSRLLDNARKSGIGSYEASVGAPASTYEEPNDTYKETMRHLRAEQKRVDDDRFYHTADNSEEGQAEHLALRSKHAKESDTRAKELYETMSRSGRYNFGEIKNADEFAQYIRIPKVAGQIYDLLSANQERGLPDKDTFVRDFTGEGDTYAETMAAIEEDHSRDKGVAVKEALGAQSTKVKSAMDNYLDTTAAKLGGSRMGARMAKGFDNDPDYIALRASETAIDNANKLVTEVERSKGDPDNIIGFFKGTYHGFKDGVFDISTWDFGITDLQDAKRMYEIVQKADNNEPLTEVEQTLLDSKAVEAVVSQYFSSQLGRGYKAGKVTAESLPFMAEMAINPASGVGKSVQSAFVRYIMKRFGARALAGSAMKRLATRGASMTVRALGDVAAAGTMAASTGQAGVLADANTRMIGNIVPDVNFNGSETNISYGGRENAEDNFATAYGKAFAARSIENHSEMLGNYMAPALSAIGKFTGKWATKGLNKAIGENRTKRLTDVIKQWNSTEGALALEDFARKTEWHGPIGEFAEEILGGIENAIIVGDQTLDTNEETGVFNKDNMIDTFLGVGLMGGFFSVAKTANYRTEHYEAEKAMNRALGKLELMMLGNEKFNQIRRAVESGEDSRIIGVIIGAQSDADLTQEQKRAILDYVQTAKHLQGVNQAIAEREQARNQQPEVQSAEEQGAAPQEETAPEAPVPNPMYEAGARMTEEEMVQNSERAKALAQQLQQLGASEMAQRIQQSVAANDGSMVDGEVQGMIDNMEDGDVKTALQEYYDVLSGLSGAANVPQTRFNEQVQALAQRLGDYMAEDGTVDVATFGGRSYLVTGETGNTVTMIDLQDDTPRQLSTASLESRDRMSVEELGQQLFGAELQQGEAKINGLLGLDENGQPIAGQNEVTGEEPAPETAPETEGANPPAVGTAGIQTDKNGKPIITAETDGAQLLDYYESRYDAYEAESGTKVSQEQRAADYQRMLDAAVDNLDKKSGQQSKEYDGTEDPIEARKRADKLAAEKKQAEDELAAVTAMAEEFNKRTGAAIKPKESKAAENAAALEKAAQEEEEKKRRENYDADGNIIIRPGVTTGQMAFDNVNELLGGDAETVGKYISSKLAEAQKKRAQAEKNKPTLANNGNNPGKFARARDAYDEKLSKARAVEQVWQDALEAWKKHNGVVETGSTSGSSLRVDGVHDWQNGDTETTAAERGYIMSNGERIDRSAPLSEDSRVVWGAETNVEFGEGENEHEHARYALVPQELVQGSHINGRRNAKHFFIKGAQPKDEFGDDRMRAAQRMGANPHAGMIDGTKAYDGAPVVNGRGEVIQGNGRTQGQRMFTPEGRAKYMELLRERAEQYGFNAEDIKDGMVLVRVADVTDQRARDLGKMNRNNSETGGRQYYDPRSVGRQVMERGKADEVIKLLTAGAQEGDSLADLMRENGEDVLRFLNREGLITDTELQTALAERNPKAVRDVLAELLTGDVSDVVRNYVVGMKDNKLSALLSVFGRDRLVADGDRLLGDVRAALQLLADAKVGRNEKDVKKAYAAIDDMVAQTDFTDGSRKRPTEEQKKLAARIATLGPNKLTEMLDDYYDGMTDTHGQGNLFGTEEKMGKEQKLGDTFTRFSTEEGAEDTPASGDLMADAERVVAESDRKTAENIEAQMKPLVGEHVQSHILGSHEDIADASTRKAVEDMLAEGKTPRAWVQTDKNGVSHVYFYLPGLRGKAGEKAIATTILHEVVQHHGMKRLLGDKFGGLMRKIWGDTMTDAGRYHYSRYVWDNNFSTNPSRRSALFGNNAEYEGKAWSELTKEERKIVMDNADFQAEAADEWAAKHLEGEGITEQGWFQSIINAIRSAARAMGFNVRLSDNELRELWRNARNKVQSEAGGAAENGEVDGGARFSEETEQNIEYANEMYNSDIEAFARGELTHPVRFGTPGPILRASGLKASEMEMTVQDLKDHVDKHGLSIDELRDLPMAINKPLLVYEWGHRNRSLVVITNVDKGGEKITVAVRLERNGHVLDVNEVASVHFKEAEWFIGDMLNAKDEDALRKALRYIGNKKQALSWLLPMPPQGPGTGVNQRLDIAKIINDFENPKIEDEKNLRFSVDEKNLTDSDREYMEALQNGDMETAKRIVDEERKKKGYDADSDYQGTSAFNGAAPNGQGYYDTKEERVEALRGDDFEGDASLGDMVDVPDGFVTGGFKAFAELQARRGSAMARESANNILDAMRRGDRKITIYRSVPKDVKENSFRNGDWVTPSRTYAVDNAYVHDFKGYRIIEQEVDFDNLWWDGNDINEWGFDDGKGYAYRNTKNNRKSTDVITYDDNGNVIPPSKRFNNRNADARFSVADSDGEDVRFSLRTKEAPKETRDVWKLMRLGKDGLLYPLFIDRNTQGLELGKWYDADAPKIKNMENLEVGSSYLVDMEGNVVDRIEGLTGTASGLKGEKPSKEQVRQAARDGMRWIGIQPYKNGKKCYINIGIQGSTKDKNAEGNVGGFAMRPGWHAGSLPSMKQIPGRSDDMVWVRGKVAYGNGMPEEAEANGGEINDHIPTDGGYSKATSSFNEKTVNWYISGAFMPEEIMSDTDARRAIDEFNKANNANVPYDVEREGGKMFNAQTRSFDKPSNTDTGFSAEENNAQSVNELEEISVSLQNKKESKDHGISESVSQGGLRGENEGNSELGRAATDIRRRFEAIREQSENEDARLSPSQRLDIIDQAASEYVKQGGKYVPFSELDKLGWLPGGSEHEVYLDGGNVVKMNNLMHYGGDLLAYFDSIQLFNSLFPTTAYEFKGLTTVLGTQHYPLVSQCLIRDAVDASPEEISKYMGDLGFEKGDNDHTFIGNGLKIWDLRHGNVIKSSEGNLYVIDAEIERLDGSSNEVLRESKDYENRVSADQEYLNEKNKSAENTLRFSVSDDKYDIYSYAERMAEQHRAEAEEKGMRRVLGKNAAIADTRRGETVEAGKRYDAVVMDNGASAYDADGFGAFQSWLKGMAKESLSRNGRFVVKSGNDLQLMRSLVGQTLGDDWVVETATRKNIGYEADDTFIIRKLDDTDLFDSAARFSMDDGYDGDSYDDVPDFDADVTTVERTQGLGAGSIYDQMLRTRRHLYSECLTDYARSLWVLEDAILRRRGKDARTDITDDIDIYNFENAMGSATAARQAEFNNLYFNPLMKLVGFIARKTGLELADVERYVYAVSGLERNRVLAERDARRECEGRLFRDDIRELESQLAELKELRKQYNGKNLTPAEMQTRDDLDRQIKDFMNYIGTPKHKADVVAKHFQEQYDHFREKDYSGLTALTGKKGIRDIEAEAQLIEARFMDAVDEANRKHGKSITRGTIYALWEKIAKANEQTLKANLETGLISKETYDNIQNMGMTHYVPLRGFAEDTAEDKYDYVSGMRQGMRAASGATVQEAKGRISMADSPFATIGAMGERAIAAGQRNVLKQKLLNLARQEDSDALSVDDMYLRYDDATDTWNVVLPEFRDGMTDTEIQLAMAQWRGDMLRAVKSDPAHYKRDDGKGQLIPYRVDSSQLTEHHVVVRENGRDVLVTLNGNPRAAQVINGQFKPAKVHFKNARIQSGMDGWNALNRFQSQLYTSMSMSFVFKNFLRDYMTGVVNSGVYHGDAHAQLWRELKEVPALAVLNHKWANGTLGNTPTERRFREFMDNGGETGYTQSLGIEGFREKAREIYNLQKKHGIKWVHKHSLGLVIDFIENTNRVIENTTRFARYEASRTSGKSILQSIADAKNVSVNFNRKGAGASTASEHTPLDVNAVGGFYTYLSQAALFVNPAMQGLKYFLVEPFLGKYATAKTRVKAGAALASAIALPIAYTFALAVMTGAGDDDDWKDFWDIPDYDRDNNIILYTWRNEKGEMEYMKLPISQELAAFWGVGMTLSHMMFAPKAKSGSEYALDMMQHFADLLPAHPMQGFQAEGKELASWDTATDMGETVLMNLLPNVTKPIAEYELNKTWKGGPMYKDDRYDEYMPNHEKGFNGTSPLLIAATKWVYDNTNTGIGHRNGIDLNPAAIEYIGKQLTGSFFTEGQRLWAAANGDKEEYAELDKSKRIPVFGSFFGTVGDKSREMGVTREFYANKGFFEAAASDIKKRYSEEEVEEWKKTDEGKWYDWFKRTDKKYSKAMSAYNKSVKRGQPDERLKERADELREVMAKQPCPYRPAFDVWAANGARERVTPLWEKTSVASDVDDDDE